MSIFLCVMRRLERFRGFSFRLESGRARERERGDWAMMMSTINTEKECEARERAMFKAPFL